ncbi:hypothetical protein F5Y17DRAFT_427818 [Xylariaceae sp. FL0594]|nr:hypothetical protein F5Y17DRAFT_427818 [Xylariaceae sp. FL0594]
MAESHVASNLAQETGGIRDTSHGETGLDDGHQQLYNYVYLSGGPVLQSEYQSDPQTQTQTQTAWAKSDWFREVSLSSHPDQMTAGQSPNLGHENDGITQHADVPAYPTDDDSREKERRVTIIERLWEEPGLELDAHDLDLIFDDECVQEQERHGLAATATGPECSVCGTPFRLEALLSGELCEVCHFI